MTLQECTALIAPLALALRAEIDQPTFRAYHRVLEDVPANLLRLAVDQAAKSGNPFFPKAGELRAMAEAQRLALSASVKFMGCLKCHESGWVTVVDPGGVRRVQRCACWKDHLDRLSALGCSTPLALPAASGDAWSQVSES